MVKERLTIVSLMENHFELHLDRRKKCLPQ